MAIIQDWKIRSRSQHCCHTGKPFEEGDEFYTCIFEDPESDGYIRKDYLAEVWDEVRVHFDPQPFSFWKSTFEVPPVEGKTEAIEKHSAEAMLRQMIEEDEPATENARYILAVMLERKKTLKPVETRETETSTLLFYEHKDNGDVFIIADPGLHLSEIEGVQEEVSALLRGDRKESPEPEVEGETEAADEIEVVGDTEAEAEAEADPSGEGESDVPEASEEEPATDL
jgi:hypothetical protein